MRLADKGLKRRLLRFRLKRETIDWYTHRTILRFREECGEGAKRFGKIPVKLEVSPVKINGLVIPYVPPLFPEATRAMEEICTFIKKHLMD